MQQLDYIVMGIFALLIFSIGMVFTRMASRNASAFFEAGGATPWWINGLSLFISYFSAGTFVVWGSIAYQHGFVANGIQLTMVFGGLLTALFIAGRWKRTKKTTAAEWLQHRYGSPTRKFYTLLVILYSLFATAAVLYPVGKMISVATSLSLGASILAIGGLIIVYTAAGGLWAVLVTDVVQFVVLTAAVLIVIPMAFSEAGGAHAFTSKAPPEFFHLFNSDYSFGFFLAFLVYQTAYIGGNWAYVQRYTSVATPRQATKVAWLFTALYLVCPFIWMLPPMIYRVLDPSLKGVQAEGAYMLLCQRVLPAGLIGLVLSGMVSATASKANTTINMVAVVFARDVCRSKINSPVSDRRAIRIARLFTVVFGGLTIGIACLVPLVGGIVEMVLSTASIAGGALFLPLVWSLYSRRQTPASLITASLAGLLISLALKLAGGPLGIHLSRFAETATGVGIPLIVLAVRELYPVHPAESAPAIPQADDPAGMEQAPGIAHAYTKQNRFGVRVIAISVALVGAGITLLGFLAEKGLVARWVGAFIFLMAIPAWISVHPAKTAR